MTPLEHQRAKQWRLDRGLSRQELADLSGYSVPAISCFERGINPRGGAIDPYAWLRFKRICHSIAVDLINDRDILPVPFNDFRWGA